MIIESLQNPKVKLIVKLKNKHARDETALFFIEGYRESLRALEGGALAEFLLYSPAHFLGENEYELIEQFSKKGVEVIEVSKAVFEKISMRDRPDGIAIVANQSSKGAKELRELLNSKPNAFLCVAESIEKPGNLGSILRSCDGVGVDALIVCDECTDVYNPNVVRSSVGTLFTVPIFEVSSKEAISLFKEFEVTIVTTTPRAKKEYTQIDYKGAVAIAMGTEQVGLTDLWFEDSFEKVVIPMMGRADSLNVASATTLVLYEALRQRRHGS
jgi:TrmH family RNA methyltransferase